MNNKNKITIGKVGEMLCVIVLLAMTFLTFINVCSRFIFHASIAASEEITTNLFVVLSLVGAALAVRGRNHIGLNIIVDRMSSRNQVVFRFFEGLCGMIFMGTLSFFGIKRVLQQLSTGMISPGLGVPMWIYGSLCLIGFVVLFASFVEVAVKAVKSLVKKEYLNGEELK